MLFGIDYIFNQIIKNVVIPEEQSELSKLIESCKIWIGLKPNKYYYIGENVKTIIRLNDSIKEYL